MLRFGYYHSLSLDDVVAPSSVLPSVTSLKLLGVFFTTDMKWDTHVEYLLSKASKRLFLIRNLRRAGSSERLILIAYKTFVQSILLYAYPVFCNAPSRLKDKLRRFEKRALRIAGIDQDLLQPVTEAGKVSCRRLFQKVCDHPSHPLQQCFYERPTTTTRRNNNFCPLYPTLTKTKRFYNSFIKFCK